MSSLSSRICRCSYICEWHALRTCFVSHNLLRPPQSMLRVQYRPQWTLKPALLVLLSMWMWTTQLFLSQSVWSSKDPVSAWHKKETKRLISNKRSIAQKSHIFVINGRYKATNQEACLRLTQLQELAELEKNCDFQLFASDDNIPCAPATPSLYFNYCHLLRT